MSYSSKYIILFLVVICIVYLYYNREYFVEGDQAISSLEKSREDGDDGDRGPSGPAGRSGPAGPSGPVGHSAFNMIMNTNCNEENTPCDLRDDLEINPREHNTPSRVVNQIVTKIITDIKADLNNQNVFNTVTTSSDEENEYQTFVSTLTRDIMSEINSDLRSRIPPSQITLQAGEVLDSMEGMIVPYCGSTPPEGWQICDGSALKDTSGEPAGITPDLRGRFILGGGRLNSASDGRIPNEYSTGATSINDEDGSTIPGRHFYMLEKENLPRHRHTYDRVGDTDCYVLGGPDPAPFGGKFFVSELADQLTDRHDPSSDPLLGAVNKATLTYFENVYGPAGARRVARHLGARISGRTHTNNFRPGRNGINVMPPYIILMYIIKQPPPPPGA